MVIVVVVPLLDAVVAVVVVVAVVAEAEAVNSRGQGQRLITADRGTHRCTGTATVAAWLPHLMRLLAAATAAATRQQHSTAATAQQQLLLLQCEFLLFSPSLLVIYITLHGRQSPFVFLYDASTSRGLLLPLSLLPLLLLI